MSDSVRPHRWQPTRLPCPWDSPGKNTGVGCHFLLQCMKVKSESEVAQSCPTPSDPMDCSLPGFSVHGIFQAKVLEWGAIPSLCYSLFRNQCWRHLSLEGSPIWVQKLLLCISQQKEIPSLHLPTLLLRVETENLPFLSPSLNSLCCSSLHPQSLARCPVI